MAGKTPETRSLAGRPYNTTMPLGQIMASQGWRMNEFAVASGVHVRTLSDYLAGRRVMLDYHLRDMAAVLGCREDEIDFVYERDDAGDEGE